MNGKQGKALVLALLVTSSCMAGVEDTKPAAVAAAAKWTGRSKLVAAGVAAVAVVGAVIGGVEAKRRRKAESARLASQKAKAEAEAVRQANRSWLDKALGR